MLDLDKAKIGFIGAGVMGRSMASRLLEAGYYLNIYTRTKEKADALVEKGAKWKETPSELAKDSDVIISIVGFPNDVEGLYFGKDGLIENAKPQSYLIDMSTSCPKIAARIYEEAKEHGCFSLDAPVSGGDIGAKNGTLSIMVGGDEESFTEVKPIFEKMGTNICFQGKAGSGQHTKMANQIAISAGMIAVSEALAYVKKVGLDPERVLSSIEKGAAASWTLSNLGPRMLAKNYDPGFFVKHFMKDIDIALKSATDMGMCTPGLELTKSLYGELIAKGGENDGTQGIFKLFDPDENS